MWKQWKSSVLAAATSAWKESVILVGPFAKRPRIKLTVDPLSIKKGKSRGYHILVYLYLFYSSLALSLAEVCNKLIEKLGRNSVGEVADNLDRTW